MTKSEQLRRENMTTSNLARSTNAHVPNTNRLRKPSKVSPMGFMLFICLFLGAAAFFFQEQAQKPEKQSDTTYYTASELYVDHETAATKALLNKELKKVRAKNKAKFNFSED